MSHISIQPLSAADIPKIWHWRQDEAFCLVNDWPFGQSDQAFENHFLKFVNPSPETIRRGVWCDGVPVGFIEFREYDVIERRARLTLAIGESSMRQQGYGLLACKQMLQFGFSELKLRRVTCEALETNYAMQILAQRLGFTLEGTLRQHRTIRGLPQNLLLFGLLSTDVSSLK